MKTLLIANRGEIALRVMRTARRLGIRTVAIHTDLDATAPHVLAADGSARVPSYLDIDAVVDAARRTGADAVHPGYGFLSERAAFARAVTEAGLVFVGPSAEVMDAMGRKDAAREIAERAGVPVVPRGEDAAYPVLVKAAAGGGGKGMRVVEDPVDLEEAMAAARREAAAAFGDDTLLLEKFVERGRHIEVQVMADAHGTVLHLFERDCSTQRRHQKVLEEAPAPTISAAVRELVLGSAVALAREVGYVNAGTVEFLLDTDTDEAYFLEMNTRLQVEHPVTEMVTGLDLVELQLHVADGEPLGLTQDDVRCEGHAIEARVYAEDAYGGFLPQAGTAELVRWPTNARVDAALEQGQVVSTAYDPMLGKITAHGPDREAARRALVAALDETGVIGFTTNVGFLRALVAGEEFREASIDTAWLDRHELAPPDPALARTVAAWTSALLTPGDGFRLGGPPASVRVELDETLLVDRERGRAGECSVTTLSAADHVVRLEVDDERVWGLLNVQGTRADVVVHGQWHRFEAPDAFGDAAAAAGDGTITAAMPGTVLSVSVAAGDRVVEGQTLGVLEAMKMELALKAPFDGTVADVGAQQGQQVALGATLFEVEPDA
ncbi:ATP-grasp domain-containing protein [Nocardioides mangrovicus]|uniref:ATP-grasp domain-containing protein n=1 Tax=Nocardioides mangrovicus TaxID=2478913 RepID=A0A3L8NYS3_9ACTN|nr:biotin carboxylase N-terminal domain-containing protein [Nocardioides mangrovicus]RLV48044.1 ATP-grasp domain-containing protein [Nocardioides mangrovicus]